LSKKNKPLPRPPKTPFGRSRVEPEDQGQELIADKMAEAAALGKLKEFMTEELPDSEHARKLAGMMMGMTGMMPQAGPSAKENKEAPAGETSVPDDVRNAVQGGDVQGLMALLRKEHQKRSPDALQEQTVPEEAPAAKAMSMIDKELIDVLIAIAKDNNVTLDWIILRAIKVYVEEHRKTGKL